MPEDGRHEQSAEHERSVVMELIKKHTWLVPAVIFAVLITVGIIIS